MKILNYGNLAIVFTLITCLILSQFSIDCRGIAFISGLFIMPAYQLLVGFIWLCDSNENKKIRYYFLGVLSYFFLMFCISFLHKILDSQKIIESIMLLLGSSIPIILAIYFTIILNKNSTK